MACRQSGSRFVRCRTKQPGLGFELGFGFGKVEAQIEIFLGIERRRRRNANAILGCVQDLVEFHGHSVGGQCQTLRTREYAPAALEGGDVRGPSDQVADQTLRRNWPQGYP